MIAHENYTKRILSQLCTTFGVDSQERLPLADPKALCGCLSDILGRTGGV